MSRAALVVVGLLAVLPRSAAAQSEGADTHASDTHASDTHASDTNAFEPNGAAEGPSPEQAPALAGHDHGFFLRSADGAYSARLLGLVQLQYAHRWASDGLETDGFLVNRARVGLTGALFTRDLRYLLVAELGRGEPQLLFLSVDYTLVADWLTVRVGRFKRPFSRSFLTMASQLSIIDRPPSVGPSAFGDDVDLGLMVHDGTESALEYAVGIFAGGDSSMARVHPLLAARVGYNTPGLDGYRESDLEGGAPRFGIAAAALVDLDSNGEHTTFVSGVLDAIFKAYGLALSAALFVGARQATANWVDQRFSGLGTTAQLGYAIAMGTVLSLEPVARYSFRLDDAGHPEHDLAGALNLYFEGHALALQSTMSARWRPSDATDPALRLQLQLSVML